MRTPYNSNQSPRVIIIQKLYGNFFNDDTNLIFAKHRFKKFIKDVVLGTIERDEVIKEEVKNVSKDFEETSEEIKNTLNESIEDESNSGKS